MRVCWVGCVISGFPLLRAPTTKPTKPSKPTNQPSCLTHFFRLKTERSISPSICHPKPNQTLWSNHFLPKRIYEADAELRSVGASRCSLRVFFCLFLSQNTWLPWVFCTFRCFFSFLEPFFCIWQLVGVIVYRSTLGVLCASLSRKTHRNSSWNPVFRPVAVAVD